MQKSKGPVMSEVVEGQIVKPNLFAQSLSRTGKFRLEGSSLCRFVPHLIVRNGVEGRLEQHFFPGRSMCKVTQSKWPLCFRHTRSPLSTDLFVCAFSECVALKRATPPKGADRTSLEPEGWGRLSSLPTI